MTRLVVAVAIVAVVGAVAWLIQRRRPEPPTQTRWAVPVQLDRADFAGAGVRWLVAVFTSATCESCADAVRKARALASPEVVVDDVEVGARKDVHDRYGIEAVPTIVLADDEGVVRASFVGPPSAADLWAAVAEARE